VLAHIGFVFENQVWVSTHYEFMEGRVIVHGISWLTKQQIVPQDGSYKRKKSQVTVQFLGERARFIAKILG